MREYQNIKDLLRLQPSHMGMIFYDKSSRDVEQSLMGFPEDLNTGLTKLTGVFVDSKIRDIKSKVETYKLKAVQLHGDEDSEYVKALRKELDDDIQILKAIAVRQESDLQGLESYDSLVDFFLLDAKGQQKGGNGVKFDWDLLDKIKTAKPFILAGGIGPNDLEMIIELQKKSSLKNRLAGIDINSSFEIKPGLKDVKAIEKFKKAIDGSEV